MLTPKSFVFEKRFRGSTIESLVINKGTQKFERSSQSDSQLSEYIKVDWGCCLCPPKGECCFAPKIYLSEAGKAQIINKLNPGAWPSTDSFEIMFWLVIDGKVWDPYAPGRPNAELPRIGSSIRPIDELRTREGRVSKSTIDWMFSVDHPDYPYRYARQNLCAICFNEGEPDKVVRLYFATIKNKPGADPKDIGEVTELGYDEVILSCKKCVYRVYARSYYSESGKCPPPRRGTDYSGGCCFEIILEQSGGCNEKGCIAGASVEDLFSGSASFIGVPFHFVESAPGANPPIASGTVC